MTAQKRSDLDMTDDEIRRRQRSRNVAVALAVVAFIGIVFAVTIVRIQAGIQASMGS
ncbi:hypothetical protein HH303_04490 [Rhodospirillaceae bacterium KN72]|uniref:Uncharacterized protein n=1 Tax=Pacificispira spongiicola TaxID=2729598 RepID=A0A7Y0DY46_9PROT|nr:hypothetical protein [Pacificispira spongiicola]NMM43723.1 hypothetical protein [Pacificispira spongiicola]